LVNTYRYTSLVLEPDQAKKGTDPGSGSPHWPPYGCRGLYIGNYPPEGTIGRCHPGEEKNMRRRREKGSKHKVGRKGKEKGRKRKEKV
jgi:hypothetical protein